jgi:hypothetical protein
MSARRAPCQPMPRPGDVAVGLVVLTRQAEGSPTREKKMMRPMFKSAPNKIGPQPSPMLDLGLGADHLARP